MEDKGNVTRLLTKHIWFLLLIFSLASCQEMPSFSPGVTPSVIAQDPPTAVSSLDSSSPSAPPTVTPLKRTYTPTRKPSATKKPSPTRKPTSTKQTKTPKPSLTPSAVLTETPTGCLSQHGNVTEKSFESEQIHKTIIYRVYEPPCYDPQANPPYPVLYLLHGQGFDVTQWSRLGAAEAADALITSGEAPPFLMVMPTEVYYLQDFDKSHFEDMIVKELVPLIDQDYATCSERRCRAVGGISRGALWAMMLGFQHWDLFGSAGAHSLPNSPLVAGEIMYWLRKMAPQPQPRIYMDSGQMDMYLGGARDFNSMLNLAGVKHDWHIFPGSHNENYWSAHVLDYLRWYSEVWKQ